MVGCVGVEIDVDRTDAPGDVPGDEHEVAAMSAARPLIAVEHAAGRVVGDIAATRCPAIEQRTRIIGGGGDDAPVMVVAGNKIEVAAEHQ